MAEEGVMIAEPKAEPQETVKPTMADLAQTDLSPAEVDLAQKNNLVSDPKKVEDPKKEEPAKVEPKKEEPAPEPEKKPSQLALEAMDDPEKEAELIKDLNKTETAFYLNQKKERLKRQAAQLDRDYVATKLKGAEERAARLEEENRALKAAPKPAVVKEPKLDVFGNPVKEEETPDDENKPVTKKDLQEIEKEKTEKEKKAADAEIDRRARGEMLTRVLNEQEVDAKARYADFAPVMELAVKILKVAPNPSEISEIFPNKREAARARKLCLDFFHATANADKFEEGDYNAADVAYELGKMHPEFGKSNGAAKSSEKNGAIEPEQAKKIAANASKRPSSAALPAGGGKRFVPYEEMNAEQLGALSQSEYAKVPADVRRRILQEA